MKSNKEIYDDFKTDLKKCVEKYGYEETKKRYLRSKRWHDVMILVIACLLVVALFILESPDYMYSTYAVMLLIFLIPAVLLKRHDLEFDELVGYNEEET